MKVLIVDDEPLIRRSLEKAFRRGGHEVSCAEDGEAGLAEWTRFLPDVVMLDVLMPKLTGPELIMAIGATSSAKVVLMTAYSGDQQSLKSVRSDLFLQKPFDDILTVVKKVEELAGV